MIEFSLLSLNTFGIPFYLGWERLGRLTRQLNELPVTALCLQEIQQNAYAYMIQRGLKSYPYFAFQRHHYAPKGGLATFSRIPYVDQTFEVYTHRGSWHSVSIADWALHKGIQKVSFELDGISFFVLNTHLNANYGGVWALTNHLTRIIYRQVVQLNEAVRSLPKNSAVIVCGDFNFPRNSFLYEELIGPNRLIDPLATDQRHTYRPFPLVPSKWKTSLDYALVRIPENNSLQVHADLIEVEDTTKKGSLSRFLTDHNALLLRINQNP